MSNFENRGHEKEMLNLIMEEIRYIRHKLDEHIQDEDQSVDRVRKEIGEIKEQLAQYRTKIGMISGGIALAVGGIISWFINSLPAK